MKRLFSLAASVLGASSLAVALALLLPQPALANPSALVVPEQLQLRAAPRDAAPALAPLIRGEALEVRGRQGDWLRVWDHGRERGGFVRSGALLAVETDPAALLVQLRLARQQVGAEGLGLGLAAALIERADVDWLRGPQGAELLEHLIALQERLAIRANSALAGQAGALLQTQVAARYGHPLRQLTRADGSHWLCPALEPATLLRGLPGASAAQQVRAALQLSAGDCAVGSLEERLLRLQDIDLKALPSPLRKTLLLRRAGLQASLAYARRADESAARASAQAALADWLRLNPAEFDDDDQALLREAAIRLAPMRWLVQEAGSLQRGKLELQRVAGQPGQSCLRIAAQTHCSHGQPLWSSLRATPDGQALLLAVQALDGWTELWRLGADGSLQVLPPAAAMPGGAAIGVAEWAGMDRGLVLIAREAVVDGKPLRRFEVLPANSLHAQPLRWAGEPMLLAAYQRGAAAEWKAGSPLAR
jgi:hypothetical protein